MNKNIWIGIVVVIIIAAGAWWYLNQSNTPPTSPIETPTTSQTTAEQTQQQNVNTSQTPTQPSQIAPANQSNSTPAPQPVTAQNQGNQMTATPATANTWQFVVSGNFALLQDAYTIDFGDGSQASLNKCPGSSNENPVCAQFSPVTHVYSKTGVYKVKLMDTTTGAGSEDTNTLLTLQLSN